MVECRFTLELTKNGIQKSVYAKAGEVNSRKLIITLTQKGKVYDLTKCSAIIFLENGDNFEADIVGDSVQAIIPNAFPEPQIRICELRLSYNNSESVLYSPMFELVIEESLGNNAEEGETLENGVQNVKKTEHDKANSHTIDMVSGLQDKLDNISEEVNSLDERVDENKNNIKHLQSEAHSHSNKESVLDKLSTTQSGKLTFNGKPVQSESNVSGGRPYDTLTCNAFLATQTLPGGDKIILGVYEDLELHGVEIKTIRVKTSEFGMVDLRFMNDVPEVENNNPYIINFCTLNASGIGFLATLAIVDFMGREYNSIVDAIVNYDVSYFEVDYYTDN